MTGFGRADGGLDGWTWTVEARSVNGRTLEMRYRGPHGFDNLERLAKASAQARFARGQVTLGLQARRAQAADVAVVVNEPLLARYLSLANQLAEDGATPPSADGLLALRGVIEAPEEEDDAETRTAVQAEMAKTVEAALDALKASRQREGAQLAPLLQDFVARIEALVGQAEAEAQGQVEAIRERFTRRIAEL
ncbi:hypothetical protein LTR94_029151, partial [Friedmanniomyces endolithicus]